MHLLVDRIIYFYIFVCISLLVFNVLYIMRRSRAERRKIRRTAFWREQIRAAMEDAEKTGRETASEEPKRGVILTDRHLRLLGRRLKKINELMAFHDAVFLDENGLRGEERAAYLAGCRSAFIELAWSYQKKTNMEQAFFAYMISVCCQDQGENGTFARALLSFLEDSTVYLREHVLRALFVLGEAEAMERAFDELTEHGWYHNTKLISDGLALYPGDSQDLVRRLWKQRERWMDSLVVAVVQYAADIPGDFSEEFFAALTGGEARQEIKFALIRYFRKKPYPPCRTYFQSLLRQEGQELAIAAAAALDAYPGEDTKMALKGALSSFNWYVRRNAALSLCNLGLTREDEEEIRDGGDRFAREMLEYVMEVKAVAAG